MDTHAFYDNKEVPNEPRQRFQTVIGFLSDANNPYYLESSLRTWPLPRWAQLMQLNPRVYSQAEFGEEYRIRVFELVRLILWRCGIMLTGEGDVQWMTEESPEQMLMAKRQIAQRTRDHLLHFLGPVVGNLFAIGFVRIGVAVANKVLAAHFKLVNAGLLANECAGYVQFVERVCSAVQQKWLPKELRYFEEHTAARALPAPSLETCYREGYQVGCCHHGLLEINRKNECLLLRSRELQEHRCKQ